MVERLPHWSTCAFTGDTRPSTIAAAGAGAILRPHRRSEVVERDFPRRNYAAEELIAELGAAFLCAEFGFDGDVRNAGYIASWVELLKADKRAFFTACSRASKAADYLRGLALAEPAERAA
jgi:antirestriction protein ArdC